MKFEEASQNIDCIKICNKFLGKLRMRSDEKKQLMLIIIWDACSNFDINKNCKFTTYLYNIARFYYLKHINKSMRDYNPQYNGILTNKHITFSYDPKGINELLDSLNNTEKELVLDRFVNKYTLLQISRKRKIKMVEVKREIKNVLQKLKNI